MTARTFSAQEMRRAEQALYEKSFYEFVKAAWSSVDGAKYKDNWHVEVICDHLQAVADGTAHRNGKQNLLINVSPGVGKSLITNVFFPAWVWTTQPEKSFLSVAHKEDLAIRDANKMRRLILGDWYQRYWDIELTKDQNSKANFENNKFGYRLCSPMANATGKRANFVLVDDPHSVQEARSDAYRKNAVDVFRGTLPTRVNDPETDSFIVIMQRLHVDDVSGYILENPTLGYDHLCIPYICTGDEREATNLGWVDPRKEGELMWAEHFSQKTVERRKTDLGPHGFSGQFQQNPVPSGDGFFQEDWFHRYSPEELPKNLHHYITSDHAPSGRGDFNVIRVWGIDENRNIWLVDSFRKRCLMDEAWGITRGPDGRWALRATGALPFIRKYQPLGWFPENDITWTTNSQIVQAAMLETRTFCAIKTLPTRGEGNKVGKAQAYQSLAASGFVHLPEGEVGDEALIEYRNFPVGKHDDQVDADGAIARAIQDVAAGYVVMVDREETRKRGDYGDDERSRSDRDLAWG